MRAGLAPGMSHSTTEERETDATIRAQAGGPDALLLADIAGTMERTARRWLTDFCEGDEQSVGIMICLARAESLPEARTITATATLRQIDGRRYIFAVTAVNEHHEPIASGEHERRITLRRRFAGRSN